MKRALRPARRRALLIACAVLAGVGALLIATLGGGHAKTATPGEVRPAAGNPAIVAGTPAAFRYLSAQRSNRCGMRPAELERYPPTRHLQGSCCDPMDQSTYEWQVKALRSYAFTAQIPRDPYDVPISLARELLDDDN